jgi:hypothetical protein
MNCVMAVELLLGLGALPGYRLQANSEDHYVYSGSQSAGDKLRRQKGNSPDRQLRSPSTS